MPEAALTPSEATAVRFAAATGVVDARALAPLRAVLPAEFATPRVVVPRYGTYELVLEAGARAARVKVGADDTVRVTVAARAASPSFFWGRGR
jgi:hypothetical protein